MRKTAKILLMTSCVNVADVEGVVLKNPDRRIFYTLESIGRWSVLDPEIKIVLCDSSNFDFNPLLASHFPKLNFECLAFMANRELVRARSKGFGEGEIIRYALQYSDLLRSSSLFIKCTAKLWVNNFNQCYSEWNGSFLAAPIFAPKHLLERPTLKGIDTRFYIVDKKFYFKYLLNLHQSIEPKSSEGLEQKFRDTILQHDLRGIIFQSPPQIAGVGGGSGKYYKVGLRRIIRDRLRYWVARKDRGLDRLFNNPNLTKIKMNENFN